MDTKGIEGEPNPQLRSEQHLPPLSNRKKHEPRIDNFLFPIPEQPFEDPIPIPPDVDQPREILELIASHLPKHILRRAGEPDRGLSFNCDPVVIPDGDGGYQLGVQQVTETAIAREMVDPEESARLLEVLQAEFPDFYQELLDNPGASNPDLPILSGNKHAWRTVEKMARDNDSFRVFQHIIGQSPSGQVRIQRDEHKVTIIRHDERAVRREVSNPEELREGEVFTGSFICTLAKFEDRDAIKVDARLPWYWQGKQGESEVFEPTIYVVADGVLIPGEEVQKIVNMVKSENRHLVTKREVLGGVDHITHKLRDAWDDVYRWIASREDYSLDFAGVKYIGPYRAYAFGQRLGQYSDSFRIFDAADDRPTLRSWEEAAREVYMTVAEAEEADAREEQASKWFLEEIIPSSKDLTPNQTFVYAAEIILNSTGPLELIREKLEGETRLVIVGMVNHPLEDDLPMRIVAEAARLGVDFIALPTRDPEDPIQGYAEDMEGLVSINVGGGVIVEMPHADAKSQYPEQYAKLFVRDEAWDPLIAKAKEMGLEVIYAEAGETYQDAHEAIVSRVSEPLQRNPDSKGVYLTPLLFSLYWPGYETHEELQAIGTNRPFVNIYSLAHAHYSDTKIPLPAYGLQQLFPNQVYSIAQFVMPKGFGQEWKYMRQVVEATGQTEPFAIGDIAQTPVAIQRYLFNAFPEMRLEDLPDEELAGYLAMGSGGYFGITEINWGKLLDGLIIYPSSKPLPKPMSPKQLIDAATGFIMGTIKRTLEETDSI